MSATITHLPCDTDEYVGASQPATNTEPFRPVVPRATYTTVHVHVNADTRVTVGRLPDGLVSLRLLDPATGYSGVSVLTDDAGIHQIITALRELYPTAGAR